MKRFLAVIEASLAVTILVVLAVLLIAHSGVGLTGLALGLKSSSVVLALLAGGVAGVEKLRAQPDSIESLSSKLSGKDGKSQPLANVESIPETKDPLQPNNKENPPMTEESRTTTAEACPSQESSQEQGTEAKRNERAERGRRMAPVDAQLIAKLEKLFEMKEDGVLSESEFQEQKRKIISGD